MSDTSAQERARILERDDARPWGGRAAQKIRDWIADRRKHGANQFHSYGFSHFETLASAISALSPDGADHE